MGRGKGRGEGSSEGSEDVIVMSSGVCIQYSEAIDMGLWICARPAKVGAVHAMLCSVGANRPMLLREGGEEIVYEERSGR